MVEILFLVPFLTGVLSFFLPSKPGRSMLVLTGVVHFILTLLVWIIRPGALMPAYFMVTPEGLLSLSVISLLFLLISVYTTAYIESAHIRNEKVFIGSMLLFLSTMTMVTLSDHIMVMWIAIESTTLASAPLIYTSGSPKSLETTWKYVFICSVGIAMALLGSVLISLAVDAGGENVPMSFSALSAQAPRLDSMWLKAGFIFILVGYGTKMGLAPMHTWLPDAHSEAPSPVSALLSGVLLNCAYLGIFKTHKIMVSAGLADFSGTILMAFGIASILAAATFILKQGEYKRLLAYSSIENMGIIAFGTGLGGIGVYGAILCLIHHSLIKSSLFLTSGNILLGYGNRLIVQTGNLAGQMPKTFVAFFAGFVGISGFPPFGIFMGELLIIVGAFRTGHTIWAGIFIASLCIIVAGFVNQVMRISFDDTAKTVNFKEKARLIWPQFTLLATSVVLSFWIPDVVYLEIVNAVVSVGGGF
ncbi:MAG: hydrogenase [Proteobacteria bacterium]|nr:hydrogenase [Pseudomonadota bacterium]MBU4472339.1 hydrogenase [Pseudomonadota bacterium]MCG2752035.1 hydrogenase [Desulfobacteraceae bacterium]